MYQDMLNCRLFAAEDRDNEVSKLNSKKARQKIRLSQRLAIENKKREITDSLSHTLSRLLIKGMVIFKALKCLMEMSILKR